MTLWKIDKYYFNDYNDIPTYVVMPHSLKGHLKCCYRWYGFRGLKWCYLFEWQAERKARKLNQKT
ncbi:MAG: hypothetical protein IJA34_00575 [Lachnospiraceae bacterium]|nr:hypothetical protein [Lachnospiraceae bacterium]